MALEDLNVAIELEPSSTNYYSRASTYVEFGKYELAIADYTLAIGDESKSENISELKLRCKYRRALAYFEIGKYDEVVTDTSAILLKDPNSVQTRALLGRALKILNDHKKAEEQLSVAILLDSGQAHLYTERGDIRFRTAQRIKVIEAIYDFDKAVDILEKKLESKPKQHAHFGNSMGMDTLATGVMVAKRGAAWHVNRKSSKFNVGTPQRTDVYAQDEGNIIDPSMLNQMHRKGSFDMSTAAAAAAAANASTSPKGRRANSISSSNGGGSFSGAEVPGVPKGATVPGSYYQDLEEQLADAFYKRAQAKLMADPDEANVRSALNDALKALAFYDADDDYKMVAASCMMRLNRYPEAQKLLEELLVRTPENYKAQYYLSFCQRAIGSQRDAIEGLTKIIAFSVPEGGGGENGNASSNASQSLNMPIHRVFEMRGTLFHEIQAHKLALLDLGKAIAINPTSADNYYLRGDCHCKLGNYELALKDFDTAEQHNFSDHCSLLIARGQVRRLLSQSEAAEADYHAAYEMMDKSDKVGKVRLLSFRAFCKIDMNNYNDAYDCLTVALQFNKEIVVEKMSKFTTSMEKIDKLIHKHLKKNGQSWHTRPLTDLEGDILYLKRIDWILHYHCALCAYQQKDYSHAQRILESMLTEGNRKFIPDDNVLGTQLFFYAQCQVFAREYRAAETSLTECSKTRWVDSKYHQFILHFTLAKIYQAEERYELSIELFNKALDVMDQNSPHAYFRRAWSYKALGDFVKAGDDFETAKSLAPDDPNFAINYKKITQCAYMEIGTDPDMIEKFPPLLPVPGLGSS